MTTIFTGYQSDSQMTKCFVDTVCWIALLNQDDQIHEDVKREYEFYMKSGCRFVTTTAVLNEIANALSGPNFSEWLWLIFISVYRCLLVLRLSLLINVCGHRVGYFTSNDLTRLGV